MRDPCVLSTLLRSHVCLDWLLQDRYNNMLLATEATVGSGGQKRALSETLRGTANFAGEGQSVKKATRESRPVKEEDAATHVKPLKPEDPGIKPEDPGVKREDPGIKREDPGVKREDPGVKREDPGVKREAARPEAAKPADRAPTYAAAVKGSELIVKRARKARKLRVRDWGNDRKYDRWMRFWNIYPNWDWQETYTCHRVILEGVNPRDISAGSRGQLGKQYCKIWLPADEFEHGLNALAQRYPAVERFMPQEGGYICLQASWKRFCDETSFSCGKVFPTMEDITEQQKVHQMAQGKSILGTCEFGLVLKADLCDGEGSAVDDGTYAIGPQLVSFVAKKIIDWK